MTREEFIAARRERHQMTHHAAVDNNGKIARDIEAAEAAGVVWDVSPVALAPKDEMIINLLREILRQLTKLTFSLTAGGE